MKKKKITLDLSEAKPLVARRRARQAVGAVKPTKAIPPPNLKPPKHKKKLDEQELAEG